MDYKEALEIATEAVLRLRGHTLDILTITKPRDLQAAIDLSKVVSKLSPIVGNTIEHTTALYLNTTHSWPHDCRWIRQDPGFPDIVLAGMPFPQPGMEVKALFPLSTEITARFRDSQQLLREYNIKVVVVCWLPEFVIAGKPKIIDVFVCNAIDIASARDTHYHNPPNYVVMEPEDTSLRTQNLQQKNCNGMRFQGDAIQLQEARNLVNSWGDDGLVYKAEPSYQTLLRDLTNRFPYRLDTNFAKIDRIALPSLEAFKLRVLKTVYAGRTVQDWINAIAISNPVALMQLVDPDAPLPVQ